MLAHREGDKDRSRKMMNAINQCNCMPACTSISYDADVSQIDFRIEDMYKALGHEKNEFQK